MSLVSFSLRPLRAALPAALLALSLTVGANHSEAQTAIQGLHDIGLNHAKAAPYNFTGRVFDLGNVGFGSGTLLRRHTVLTAGHVVFEPATGFLTSGTFTRGLYKTFSLSKDQVISAQALSGYQALATTAAGAFTLEASAFDMGIVLVNRAPVDNNWGVYLSNPPLLASSATFVLGYPGVSYDGRTLAFVVPSTSWVGVGTDVNTALYENDETTSEPGTSGGPIYVVPDGVHQSVEATVVGGLDDSSGEFNAFYIRAIDKAAARFIANAEYTSGLIKRVRISGPKIVSRGHTYTYTAVPVFTNPSRDGTDIRPTTDRYSEVVLSSNTPGTTAQPLVTVKKTSNTTFDVTFSNNVRAGSLTTLQVNYDGTAVPNGKSSLPVKIQ